MKKSLLLLLPAIALLAGCNKKGPTSNSSSSQKPSSSSEEEIVYADVTLNFTVSGIETYEEGHSTIWMFSDAIPNTEDPTKWGLKVLTQDATNVNLWSTTLTHFELEQSITYNLFFGSADAPDYTYGENLHESGENFTILTNNNQTTYSANASFHVPTKTGEVDISITLTPKLKSSASAAEVDLSEHVNVFTWVSTTDETKAMTKNGDGSWTYEEAGVDLMDGVAKVGFTPVLGILNPNWTYNYGGYVGNKWSAYGATYFNFTADEASKTFDSNVLFNAEPSNVTKSFKIEVTPVWKDSTVTDPNKSTLYIAGAADLISTGTASGTWKYSEMTYDSEKSVFTYDVTDCPLGNYGYNVYALKKTDVFNWQNKASETDMTFEVSEETGSSVAKSFEWESQPGVGTETRSFTISLTPDWSGKTAEGTPDIYIAGDAGLITDGEVDGSWKRYKMSVNAGVYTYSAHDVEDSSTGYSYQFYAVIAGADFDWSAASKHANFNVVVGETIEGTTVNNEAAWDQQPGYEPEVSYQITFNLTFDTETSTATGGQLQYADNEWVFSSSSYVALSWTEGYTYSVTLTTDKTDFYFGFKVWGNDWADSRIETEEQWVGYHITISNTEINTASVDVSATGVNAGGTAYYGLVTASTNCAISEGM